MGYDNIECLMCYIGNRGNNPVDTKDDVCMKCICEYSGRITPRAMACIQLDKITECSICLSKNILGCYVSLCYEHYPTTKEQIILNCFAEECKNPNNSILYELNNAGCNDETICEDMYKYILVKGNIAYLYGENELTGQFFKFKTTVNSERKAKTTIYFRELKDKTYQKLIFYHDEEYFSLHKCDHLDSKDDSAGQILCVFHFTDTIE